MMAMRRIILGLIMIWVVVAVGGCGGGDDHDDDFGPVRVETLSEETIDGFISESAVGSRALTIGASTLLAGVHPISATEYRGFLHFPLDEVPLNAAIDSAFLEIYIRSYQSQALSFPLLIELVDFEPPLILDDFDRILLPPQSAIPWTILASDLDRIVRIDVTPLMLEAQRQGLPSFQVRLLEDLGADIPALIGIDDSENEFTAPLLTVRYF